MACDVIIKYFVLFCSSRKRASGTLCTFASPGSSTATSRSHLTRRPNCPLRRGRGRVRELRPPRRRRLRRPARRASCCEHRRWACLATCTLEARLGPTSCPAWLACPVWPACRPRSPPCPPIGRPSTRPQLPRTPATWRVPPPPRT